MIQQRNSFHGTHWLLRSGLRTAIVFSTVALTMVFSSQAHAQVTLGQHGIEFDLKRLQAVPQTEKASDVPDEGLNAIFFEGLPYQGKPTKVFAYYGLPKKAAEESATNSVPSHQSKVPGVVLVHGGGGTAFARWVKLWNDRGYAAIAMDLCGCVPVGTYGKWQRHDNGGPPGWDASFDQISQPLGDQWQTHAISSVSLGHSLLASLPEVDSECIGLTGISWGGYMTCLVAGVDTRFRCAVPVYGCGYLGANSAWLPQFERLGKDRAESWLQQWDPAEYLPKATMPFLWVNGTNDFAYPMDSWQRSAQLHKAGLSAENKLCLRIRMPHGHGAAGENPEEIHVFMNSILKNGQPLPTIQSPTCNDRHVTTTYESTIPVTHAELCYTLDRGKWQERKWEAAKAEINKESKTITAELPENVTVWYINLIDERNCVISTAHVAVN